MSMTRYQLPKINFFDSINRRGTSSVKSAETTHEVELLVSREMAIQFVHQVPSIMCLIDTEGCIMTANTEFKTHMDIKFVSKMPNILEIVTIEYLDHFYKILQEIRECENNYTHKLQCACKIRNKTKRSEIVTMQWSFSRDSRNDYAIVSGHILPNNVVTNSSTEDSIKMKAKLAPLNLSAKNSNDNLVNIGNDNTHGFSLEDDVFSLQNSLPSHQWSKFKSNVETKTKRFIELQQEQIKNQALADTLETKRLFVRHVGHEIRTPLNIVMSGFMLLDNLRSNISPAALEILEEMQSACGAAIDILNDLLTYEKLDSNILSLDKSHFDVIQNLKNTIKMFQVQARSAGIEVRFSNEIPVHQVSSSAYVDGDSTKIAQVIRNMISNALKFTPSNGHVTVKVCLNESDHKRLRIEVHDTGPGIAKEDRKRLFNEVIQFNPKELQGGQGSGLGLYLSRKIIDMHEGHIGVDLEHEGAGSMFFVELPMVDRSVVSQHFSSKRLSIGVRKLKSCESKDSSHNSIHGGTSCAIYLPPILDVCSSLVSSVNSGLVSPIPSGSLTDLDNTTSSWRYRVLLVDDAALCRRFHGRILTPLGCDCIEAANGQEAVDVIKDSMQAGITFDCILMDSSMPVMDGPNATQIIRELGYQGKIYGVTGNGFEADIADFIAHGADQVLIKPLKQETFSYIISTLVETGPGSVKTTKSQP